MFKLTQLQENLRILLSGRYQQKCFSPFLYNGAMFASRLNYNITINIDMFASRLNYKVKDYVAWRPDPGVKLTDAFCFNWEPYFFYAFPPFSLISQCLKKIEGDKATGVLIVPFWATQTWFSVLMNLVIDSPLVLPQSDNLVLLPQTGEQHTLWRKMRLMACKLSGQVSSRKIFLAK